MKRYYTEFQKEERREEARRRRQRLRQKRKRQRLKPKPLIPPPFHCSEDCPVCTLAKMFKLTHREVQVIALLCTGLVNDEIAQIYGVNEQRIKNWIWAIIKKTGARNRFNLGLWAVQVGLISPFYYSSQVSE